MTLDEQIMHWAENVKKDFLIESTIPNDEYSLVGSFKGDVSEEKFSPTQEFLEKAYQILLKKLFDSSKMPPSEQLMFIVKSLPRKNYLGLSTGNINRMLNTVIPLSITLNSSRKLSLHEWLEVVLHEMIHIYDYKNNPQNYLGFFSRSYDAHGRWFMDFGRQFDEYGFNVQQFYKKEIEINIDDKKVSQSMNKTVFMFLDGFEKKYGQKCVAVISSNNIKKYKDFISEGKKRGRYETLERVVFMKSENPNIVRLRKSVMRDSHSSLRFFYFDDNFEKKYGPFQEIETFDLKNSMNEDKDEVEYDEMNHIDDEYARKMYDNIKGVVNVEKIDDEEYKIDVY